MTHPAPRSEREENTDPAAEMAEMLALIGKVTADLSDRMEAQDKVLEDIRTTGRESNALIAEQAPLSSVKVETLKRSLTGLRQEAARQDAKFARMELEALDADSLARRPPPGRSARAAPAACPRPFTAHLCADAGDMAPRNRERCRSLCFRPAQAVTPAHVAQQRHGPRNPL